MISMRNAEEKGLAPRIRFAGFTDAWEQRRLGDFGHVAMCKRIYKEQTSDYNDVPFFKIGTFGSEPDAYITEELFEQYRSLYPYPKPGTLLISAAGSIGRIVEYKGERAYYQDSNIVWLEHNDELDDSFLKQSLVNTTWTLEGSTIKRLYNKDILGKQIAAPSVPEQRAIGSFFQSLDDLIALHQRKCDGLKTVKKSLLEKMFPREGEATPELRFAGFTDAWEQRVFADFTSASGARNRDGLPLKSYSVSNDRGFVPQDEQFEMGGTMRDADKTAYWIVEPGSFAYNPARINVGSIGYLSTSENVIVSSLYEVFRTDATCDDRFLWHWLKSSLFAKQIEMLQEGGVRLYYFFDKLLKSEIWMPSVSEQGSMGRLFDALDDLIALHQRKLDLLKNVKKSLLEGMFV